MLLTFALTLFTSATLLFLVQPMVGKSVLPLLGGTPAVWNTCMVFFQALLLAGYAYAHWLTKTFRPRTQLGVHSLVLLLPIAPLLLLHLDTRTVADSWLPPGGEANPIPWLLTVLFLTAGVPFFVVSTSAPLLQKWFAGTKHPLASDPYFLYGASNLGSMLALLGYPTLVEARLGLAWQATLWTGAYAGLVALTVISGLLALRWAAPVVATREMAGSDATDRVGWLTWLRWVALAAVPSSLMLGVTSFMTTDIAPMPLLWVLPLALYLLSFIFVFSSIAPFVHWLLVLLFPLVVIAVTSTRDTVAWLNILKFAGRIEVDQFGLIALHLVALFWSAMVCHGELARTRPATRYLTGFYLAMSLGGVLGGLFNALVAPFAFDRIIEYPAAMLLIFVLMPRWGMPASWRIPRFVEMTWAMLVALFAMQLGIFCVARESDSLERVVLHSDDDDTNYVDYPLLRRLRPWPLPFLRAEPRDYQHVLTRRRNFFGSFSVLEYDETKHYLYHGTTTHGMQNLDPAHRFEALAYFQRKGPIGQLFRAVDERHKPMHVGVLGVGTGTLAAYMKPGWELTLFEIDKAVVDVAYDPRYFTYLADCEARGVPVRIHMGDGRLQLAKMTDGSFDLLFMDAFTSDAVPVHLLTREAIDLYLRKLAPGGILVINIANRYLDFEKILGNVAVEVGIQGRAAYGKLDDRVDLFASAWVLLARDEADFAHLPLGEDDLNEWHRIGTDPRLGVWRDDYSNLLAILDIKLPPWLQRLKTQLGF